MQFVKSYLQEFDKITLNLKVTRRKLARGQEDIELKSYHKETYEIALKLKVTTKKLMKLH
jgi:hypothetical protein